MAVSALNQIMGARSRSRPIAPGVLLGGLALLSLAFLAFLGGAFVVLHKVWPYFWLHGTYSAALAAAEHQSFSTPFETNLWAPARRPDRGVTIYDPAKAYDGLTFYTSGHSQEAFLISMRGRVVHGWNLPFSRIWHEGSGIARPRPDDLIYPRMGRVMPNGDLIVMYVAMGETPWGYALVRMDRDSQPLWAYFGPVHHNFDIGPDGRIYVLTNHIRWNEIPDFEQLEPPRLDDFVLVLSPDGVPLKEVSIVDAFARSPYARLLTTAPPNALGDYLHTNDVELVGAAGAAQLPFARPGQVLISIREISTLALLDLEKEEIVWTLRGPWFRQHDPDLLPNGNILLFDNLGYLGPGGRSRVMEFDPLDSHIVWSYAGDERHPFHSELRSRQQRLPNGNTLITESDGGRLFETTPGGEIVWEFVNPVRGGSSQEFIPVVSGGARLGWKELEGFVSP